MKILFSNVLIPLCLLIIVSNTPYGITLGGDITFKLKQAYAEEFWTYHNTIILPTGLLMLDIDTKRTPITVKGTNEIWEGVEWENLYRMEFGIGINSNIHLAIFNGNSHEIRYINGVSPYPDIVTLIATIRAGQGLVMVNQPNCLTSYIFDSNGWDNNTKNQETTVVATTVSIYNSFQGETYSKYARFTLSGFQVSNDGTNYVITSKDGIKLKDDVPYMYKPIDGTLQKMIKYELIGNELTDLKNTLNQTSDPLVEYLSVSVFENKTLISSVNTSVTIGLGKVNNIVNALDSQVVDLTERLAKLESDSGNNSVNDLERQVVDLTERLEKLESDSGNNNNNGGSWAQWAAVILISMGISVLFLVILKSSGNSNRELRSSRGRKFR